MFELDLNGHDGEYELKELIKMWPPAVTDDIKIVIPRADMDRNEAKRYVYDLLKEKSGYGPEWGILTGVRPVKLVNEMLLSGKTEEQVVEILANIYRIDEKKISLLTETSQNQRYITDIDTSGTAGLYIGIPFCPTRCLYCSFTSNQVKESEMERYAEALITEIRYAGAAMKDAGIVPESLYFGGGTPTSLPAEILERVLASVQENIDLSALKEYCVEAGRPDTFTEERMRVLKAHGVGRISINPQTMHQKTLDLIGRRHTVEDVESAFEMAGKFGFEGINADIIAGLPGEDEEDFMFTLKKMTELKASNITVHTLAVKRASKLREADENYHYKRGGDVGFMVDEARRLLGEEGYEPYYLYRQKHMTGNYENVGYTKPGMASVYNIRIMDEHQSIIALGAGGISKRYYPETNRLVRVPNVSNYQIYIERLDEMIGRKKDKLFSAE